MLRILYQIEVGRKQLTVIFKQTGTARNSYINGWLLIMLRSIFKQHKEENHTSMGWLWIVQDLEN